jgi:hypothetical protein
LSDDSFAGAPKFLVPLYLSFQKFAREMYPALDRAQGLLQHLCNLVVFEPVKIQEEGIAEDFGQIVDGCLYIFYTQVAFRRIGDNRLVII